MTGVTKSFGGNCVLAGVGLSLRAHEVHALVGENGAGKSTLMKILNGVYTMDSGGRSVWLAKLCAFRVRMMRGGLASV